MAEPYDYTVNISQPPAQNFLQSLMGIRQLQQMEEQGAIQQQQAQFAQQEQPLRMAQLQAQIDASKASAGLTGVQTDLARMGLADKKLISSTLSSYFSDETKTVKDLAPIIPLLDATAVENLGKAEQIRVNNEVANKLNSGEQITANDIRGWSNRQTLLKPAEQKQFQQSFLAMSPAFQSAAKSGMINVVNAAFAGDLETAKKSAADVQAALVNSKDSSPAAKSVSDSFGKIVDLINSPNGIDKNILALPAVNAAKGVFNKFGGTEDSRTIDAFLNGPIEGVRQLKDALKNKQEGVQAVQDWIVNDLASSVGDSATPAKINAWLSKRNVEGWLKEFPEALPTINAYLSDVSKATEAEGAMTAAVRTAKQRLQGVKIEPAARQDATVVREAAKRAAAAQVRQAQETAANSATARVIGKEPISAITSVMESGNPAKAAKELSDLAATDKTGKATEGLKNAVRQYMDEQRVRFGEVVSTLEDPTVTVTMDQLATSYAGLNKMLTAGTQERQVLEQILGKGSRELNMMDMYRGQLETMERFRRASAGQSVTSLNMNLKQQFEDKMANNLLGVLGRFAYNALPEGARYGASGTAIRALSDLTSKLSWTGDPSARSRAIMIEAMTDKNLMAQLLRPIDKKNLPEAKAFIKTYLVPQGANQPQQESN